MLSIMFSFMPVQLALWAHDIKWPIKTKLKKIPISMIEIIRGCFLWLEVMRNIKYETLTCSFMSPDVDFADSSSSCSHPPMNTVLSTTVFVLSIHLIVQIVIIMKQKNRSLSSTATKRGRWNHYADSPETCFEFDV